MVERYLLIIYRASNVCAERQKKIIVLFAEFAYDYNEIAELRKTRVAKKRNRTILREITFVNDCANCGFFAQN